ncbi:hypothetical protein ACU61A_30810 [Pseudonocardia sichuanensis]
MFDASTTLTRLVAEFAARDRPDRDPDDLPVIVLWGARGSESSALLTDLLRVRTWNAPRAHLDGEQLPTDLRPHLVANRLAFQLGRHVERFGRARFPRFFLGAQAVRAPLDPDVASASQVRKELIRRQLRNRPEGRQWLRESAQALAALAGLGDNWNNAAGLIVDGALEAARTAALLRGAGVQWYRDGLGHHSPDPVDALVELSVAEFLGNRALVDEVLCRAFVADLRGEYESGAGMFFVRRTSALVLLDNVAMPPTSRFVDLLTAQAGTSGPLVVVASSHLRFPEAAAQDTAGWQPDDLPDASPARWSAQRPGRGGSRYYPVWVDPVDDVPATTEPAGADVQAIAHGRGLRPAQHPSVAFARRLTAAHPAGLDMVFSALEGIGGVPGHGSVPARYDLRGLFGLEERRSGKRLDDTVFDLVLGSRTETMRRALMLMGIAVDLSDLRFDPILDTEDEQIGLLVTEFRERDLWVTHHVTEDGPEPPRMHPFARRAIAHRLGRDDGVSGVEWETAHTVLRTAAAARADRVGELYHDLALGRIGEVAWELSELFDPENPRGWYALLLQVARAPLARPALYDDAVAHFGQLCAGIDSQTTVSADLVAALQLHTDPLADPFHDTCGIVGHELGRLSGEAVTGKAFLLKAKSEFDSCWKRWH